MKLKSSIIILPFILLIYSIGFSQINTYSKPDRYYLVGTWELESRNSNGFIVLKRKIGNQKKDNGSLIEISNNGTINLKGSRMKRRCGNDFRKSKGAWRLDKINRIFTTTIPTIVGFKKFRIIKLNIREMILN